MVINYINKQPQGASKGEAAADAIVPLISERPLLFAEWLGIVPSARAAPVLSQPATATGTRITTYEHSASVRSSNIHSANEGRRSRSQSGQRSVAGGELDLTLGSLDSLFSELAEDVLHAWDDTTGQ
jgi:hypothetical protein